MKVIVLFDFLLFKKTSLRVEIDYKLVMCSVSTNGERASLASLKLTIGSLLAFALSLSKS